MVQDLKSVDDAQNEFYQAISNGDLSQRIRAGNKTLKFILESDSFDLGENREGFKETAHQELDKLIEQERSESKSLEGRQRPATDLATTYKPSIVGIEEIMRAQDPKILWYCFVKGMFNSVAGSSESGKSSLMFQLSLAIVNRQATYLDFPVEVETGKVLYVSTEDGDSQFKQRIEAIGLDSIKEEFRSNIKFLFSAKGVIESIERELISLGFIPDLVVIDTWGDYVGGKYSNDVTREEMTKLRMLCLKHGTTIVAIHHTSKLGGETPQKDSLKGASDFEQGCRSVAFISSARGSKWLATVKANHMSAKEKDNTYRLDYDPKTMRIYRSSEVLSRAKLTEEIRNGGAPVKELDFANIDNDKAYTYTELYRHIMNSQAVSERTAKTRIKEASESRRLTKLEDGRYCTPEFASSKV